MGEAIEKSLKFFSAALFRGGGGPILLNFKKRFGLLHFMLDYLFIFLTFTRKKMFQKHGMMYFETSVKNGGGIVKAVNSLLSSIVRGMGDTLDPTMFAGSGVEVGAALVHDRQHWKKLYGSAALDDLT